MTCGMRAEDRATLVETLLTAEGREVTLFLRLIGSVPLGQGPGGLVWGSGPVEIHGRVLRSSKHAVVLTSTVITSSPAGAREQPIERTVLISDILSIATYNIVVAAPSKLTLA